jgi:hypothetical protein
MISEDSALQTTSVDLSIGNDTNMYELQKIRAYE